MYRPKTSFLPAAILLDRGAHVVVNQHVARTDNHESSRSRAV